MGQPVSLNPKEFKEGGLPTDNRNVKWTNVGFQLFDYTNKAGESVGKTTTALRVAYKDEQDKDLSVQMYSVGDPERIKPSEDGKTLVAVVEGAGITKTSNAGILITALVNAGFPENKLSDITGDISKLNGMVTYNIAQPEQDRPGLNKPKTDAQGRVKTLSVPSKIVLLPWEKGAAKSAAPAAKEGEVTPEVLSKIMAITDAAITAGGGKTTRQKIGTKAVKDLAKDPLRQVITGLVFGKTFTNILTDAGYVVDGENISAAAE